MSTVITKNVQIGNSGTGTNNFTLYQPLVADSTVRLANGNSGTVTDLLTITAAGNVGINRDVPDSKFCVFSGTSPNAANIQIGYTGLSYNYYDANYHIFRNGSFTETARIDNVGAITATSFNSITALSSTLPLADGTTAVGTSTTVARADHIHPVSGGGGATIVNDISTDTNYFPLASSTISGTASTIYTSNTKLTFNPSTGTFSATQFTSLSDRALKTNITRVDGALDVVRQLDGVEFDWKDGGHSSGLIAQDLEKVLPFLINTAEYKSINYSGLVAYLINSIKELEARVIELEAQ
jgi:hypothetical protein